MTAPAADPVGGSRSGFRALKRVFSEPAYRALFSASLIAQASQWMQRIALGWLLWENTESAMWLGLMAMAELAPGLVFGPLGGVLADRLQRRRLALICQSVIALQSLAVGILILADLIAPGPIIALVALGGSAAALQESARSLLLRDVTPRDCLATGMSLVAVSVNVTRFLGPALAGPLMVLFGVASVFWINAAAGLVLIAVVATLKTREPAAKAQSRGFGFDLWNGLVLAATDRRVAPVLAVFACTSLLVRPLYELMAAFAGRLFQGSQHDYSNLVMSVGAGAVIGALVVTLSAPSHPGRVFMWASLGACGALAAFAFSPSMLAAISAIAVLGFFMCISATTSQLVMILESDSKTSGRILSLWSALMRGGPALGSLAMGVAVDMLGYRWPLLVAAGASAIVILLLAAKTLVRPVVREGRPETVHEVEKA